MDRRNSFAYKITIQFPNICNNNSIIVQVIFRGVQRELHFTIGRGCYNRQDLVNSKKKK